MPGTSSRCPYVFSIDAFLLQFAILSWDREGCLYQGSGHFPPGTNWSDIPDAAAARAFFCLWQRGVFTWAQLHCLWQQHANIFPKAGFFEGYSSCFGEELEHE